MDILEFISQNAVSGLAVIVSCVSAYFTNRMNKKVNKKDFEIAENLKYELTHLLATLRSLKAKAVLSPHLPKKIGLSQELTVLSELRMSPGFLLCLHALDDDEDKWKLQFLTMYLSAIGEELKVSEIIDKSEQIERLLQKIDSKKIKKVNIFELLKEFSNMKEIAPAYKELQVKENEEDVLFKTFINNLVESGNTDPDVMLWHAVLTNDKDKLSKAADAGAKLNVTDKEMIKRYQTEYYKLIKAKGESPKESKNKTVEVDGELLKAMIVHLVEGGNTDPDLLLWQGVLTNDVNIVKKAIDAGANPNVTDIEIIKRYQAEYEALKNKDQQEG